MTLVYDFQSLFLVEEGALPSQVDDVMEGFGMKLGIFKTMDLSGKLVPLWNFYFALLC